MGFLPRVITVWASVHLGFGKGNGNPLHVFLPGKSHGRKSLVDYSPRGHKESDTTEQSSTAQTRPYALLNEVLKANGVNNVN